jgi:copper chaperone
VDAVAPFLNETVGEGKWNVDLQSQPKILTVNTEINDKQVIEAMNKAGYKAEPVR